MSSLCFRIHSRIPPHVSLSCLFNLLWPVRVSQSFLVSLSDLMNTGLGLYRISQVCICLMFSSWFDWGYGLLERISQRWNDLIIWYQGTHDFWNKISGNYFVNVIVLRFLLCKITVYFSQAPFFDSIAMYISLSLMYTDFNVRYDLFRILNSGNHSLVFKSNFLLREDISMKGCHAGVD